MKGRLRKLYYGLITDFPKDGIEYEGEIMMMPFSPPEPPYIEWVAIFETVSEKPKKTKSLNTK
jgi:hypothetical protein